MRNVDDLFHCAGAVSGAGASGATVLGGIATNLVLTARVLEAAAAAGVQRCLVFSSSTVYPELDRPLREEDADLGPPHPAYAGYGAMRRYVEQLARLVAAQSRTRVAIVRPTAVYGRHDNFDPATSHFVAALIRRAVAGERPFEVWGTGDETRDLLHVTDLARGCLLALDRYACAEPLNIGSGETVTVAAVARLVLDAAGRGDAELRFNPARPVTVRARAIDCSRARAALDFAPAVPLADGLRDTVAWYSAQAVTNEKS
jgi:GDP-L-fucose synthase